MPFDVFTLQKDRERQNKINKATYEPILNIVIKFIKDLNKQYKSELTYEVPLFRPLTPQYKVEDCMTYIKEQLEAKLFKVKIIGPTRLKISWEHADKMNPNAFKGSNIKRLVWNK